jgi:hypothetical protein
MRESVRLERERAECFDRALALRLSPSPCRESAAVQEELRVATRLAALDFRAESRIEASLGAQIARLAEAPAPAPGRPAAARALRLAFAAAVVASLLTLLHPGARAAVLEALRGIVTLRRVGRHSKLVHVDEASRRSTEAEASRREYRQELEEGKAWDLDIPGVGGFAGPVPPGAEPVVRYVRSLKVAAGLAAVDLVVPARLPGCADADLAFHCAFVTPDGGAILVYRTPGGTIALQELPLGWVRAPDGSRRRVFRSTASSATGARTLTIRGQRLGWVLREDGSDYGLLVWEKDDVGYQLSGERLTIERAKEVFQALAPCPRPSTPPSLPGAPTP